MAEGLYTDWLYLNQTYSAGRYIGQAYQSPIYSVITTGGHTGWIATENGYTTVTMPLPGDQTFFFGSTASAATIESLASVSLTHLDDLFPRVGTPTPDPALSC